MFIEMQIKILNGGEILVICKFKLNQNLVLNLYCEILRNSNHPKSHFKFVQRDTTEFEFLDFD